MTGLKSCAAVNESQMPRNADADLDLGSFSGEGKGL